MRKISLKNTNNVNQSEKAEKLKIVISSFSFSLFILLVCFVLITTHDSFGILKCDHLHIVSICEIFFFYFVISRGRIGNPENKNLPFAFPFYLYFFFCLQKGHHYEQMKLIFAFLLLLFNCITVHDLLLHLH